MNPPGATGKRVYDRKPGGDWQLTCVQHFDPVPGVTKIMQMLDGDGAESNIVTYYRHRDPPGMFCRVVTNNGAAKHTIARESDGVIRYRRADGSVSAELEHLEDQFRVAYFASDGSLKKKATLPYASDEKAIEFLNEGDADAVRFVTFAYEHDDDGRPSRATSSVQNWVYSYEGSTQICAVYKDGEHILDQKMELVFDREARRQLEYHT